MDREKDGRLEIPPCVLQDIESLGLLPKKNSAYCDTENSRHSNNACVALPICRMQHFQLVHYNPNDFSTTAMKCLVSSLTRPDTPHPIRGKVGRDSGPKSIYV